MISYIYLQLIGFGRCLPVDLLPLIVRLVFPYSPKGKGILQLMVSDGNIPAYSGKGLPKAFKP